MTNLTDPELLVGVVGAGAMGAGIAQVTAVAGRKVFIYDQRDGAAEAARKAVLARLDKRVVAGKMSGADREACARRLQPIERLEDFGSCGLVIEAIVEDLEAKRGLFRALADIVRPEAVLASNTSSLPIGAIAVGLAQPDRFAGLHFFNPVPVMKLVEVIAGPDTRRDVVDGLIAFGRLLGRNPVEARDTPGFLVNYGGRAYATEALAILNENVASPSQVDAVMRDCWGFRMGPFELMDFTGIDVNYPVTEFVHRANYGDPRLRTTFQHRYMTETGQLGRKTGRGFYSYPESAVHPTPDATLVDAPTGRVAVVDPDGALTDLLTATGAQVISAENEEAVPLLVALWGEDCAAFCARTGTDHRRLVAVDLSGDISQRVTLMTAPGGDPVMRDSVAALLGQARAVTVIQDSPGFIGQRIATMIANLGCEMAQLGLAAPADIDLAMRLGLNYPKGPLELADSLGPDRVYAILSEMQRLTGDDRYRPSAWLRRRASLGLSALQIA
ncbi:3-hydroxyacyl-CoA dehydrogenase [Pararhodobacter sp. SW119]|uniref:3-hydroxyacyl-CoA dehydrogenase n=1 Tax=Pararhodobacter sp. SW119 TaxID=2780075 RepID=UPI001AE06BDA|nr:3-hydroxyacyl-CoA dehydrogenase [Pararhodobacter sp. SW119]